MSFEYTLQSRVDKIKFAREGARVERTHASPGIGSHSVGMHSFNMLTLLLILKPDANGKLIRAVIQHDIPERITGDMPHPAKKAGVQNDDRQKLIESYLNELVFGYDAHSDLGEVDQMWLSGLDMLEFYLYCRDQEMIGNKSIRTKLRAVEEYMHRYRSKYPEQIVDLYFEISQGDWETLPDAGGL